MAGEEVEESGVVGATVLGLLDFTPLESGLSYTGQIP